MASEWMMKHRQFLVQYECLQSSAGTINLIWEEFVVNHGALDWIKKTGLNFFPFFLWANSMFYLSSNLCGDTAKRKTFCLSDCIILRVSSLSSPRTSKSFCFVYNKRLQIPLSRKLSIGILRECICGKKQMLVCRFTEVNTVWSIYNTKEGSSKQYYTVVVPDHNISVWKLIPLSFKRQVRYLCIWKPSFPANKLQDLTKI